MISENCPKKVNTRNINILKLIALKIYPTPRRESYKLTGEIVPLELISSSEKWIKRQAIVLQNVYYEKHILLKDFKNTGTLLAIFKPFVIKSFEIQVGEKSSDFKFWYRFVDFYQLTRKLLAKLENNEHRIKEVLKVKYFEEMKQKDAYLFLGTSRKWHIRKAKNPFMITGIFHPPYA